jgi:hypothetical protein
MRQKTRQNNNWESTGKEPVFSHNSSLTLLPHFVRNMASEKMRETDFLNKTAVQNFENGQYNEKTRAGRKFQPTDSN